MPTKNSTGTGTDEGKGGTVKKPKGKKMAIKKETLADPAAPKDALKKETHTCDSKRCY